LFYIFVVVASKFPEDSPFHLVLECDGASVDDDDVLDAAVAEGYNFMVWGSGQCWSPASTSMTLKENVDFEIAVRTISHPKVLQFIICLKQNRGGSLYTMIVNRREDVQ
jgi:hypothetical protein